MAAGPDDEEWEMGGVREANSDDDDGIRGDDAVSRASDSPGKSGVFGRREPGRSGEAEADQSTRALCKLLDIEEAGIERAAPERNGVRLFKLAQETTFTCSVRKAPITSRTVVLDIAANALLCKSIGTRGGQGQRLAQTNEEKGDRDGPADSKPEPSKDGKQYIVKNNGRMQLNAVINLTEDDDQDDDRPPSPPAYHCPPFYCPDCSITTTSSKDFARHMSGRKHRDRLAKAAAAAALPSTSGTNRSESRNKSKADMGKGDRGDGSDSSSSRNQSSISLESHGSKSPGTPYSVGLPGDVGDGDDELELDADFADNADFEPLASPIDPLANVKATHNTSRDRNSTSSTHSHSNGNGNGNDHSNGNRNGSSSSGSHIRFGSDATPSETSDATPDWSAMGSYITSSTGRPPWLGKESVDTFVSFHDEVEAFNEWAQPQVEETVCRTETFGKIHDLCKSMFPRCGVHMFGSVDTGLYLPISDVDIVVMDAGGKTAMYKLSKRLKKESWVSNLKVIAHARVPILKFTDSDNLTDVDIAFDQTSGLESSSYIRDTCVRHPQLKPVTLLFKYFLRLRSLNEPFTGGMGSYAVVLIVLSHLQMHSLHSQDQPHYDPNDLGGIVADFLALYGAKYNYLTTGISVRKQGAYFQKIKRGWGVEQPMRMSVEDPQDTSNDVGKGTFQILQIRRQFADAHARLLNLARAPPRKPRPRTILQEILRSDPDMIHTHRMKVVRVLKRQQRNAAAAEDAQDAAKKKAKEAVAADTGKGKKKSPKKRRQSGPQSHNGRAAARKKQKLHKRRDSKA